MRFSTTVVLSVLAASSAVSAAPLVARDDGLVDSLIARGPGGKPKYVNRPGGKRDELVEAREWDDALVARGRNLYSYVNGDITKIDKPKGKRDELVEAREWDDALDLVARYFGDDMELFERELELEEAAMKRDLEWDLD